MTTPKAKLAGLALIAVLCAGFTLGLTAPARAGVAEGSVAYLVGDYATAIREFRPLAEQGISAAQYFLGLMYYKGKGVPQDFAEAMKWYRKAAEQGYTLAQYNLGRMYYKGQGVPTDYVEAVGWWRQPAEQGYTFAQFNLGVMYYNGQGVPQDFAEAVKWYRKAAEQENALAQYNLGLMYSRGQGVTQDYVQAHVWINLAVSKSPPGKSRDTAVGVRDFVAKRMTPAQISEAQKLAREWRPKWGRVPGRPAASRL